MVPSPPWTIAGDGVRLALRLTPRASADRIDGIGADSDGRPLLLLRLKAPPVEGAANAALIAYLAKALGVRKADVAIVAGETGRTKRLRIAGDAQAVVDRLAALVSP
ncbi:MAG: hypothetical protein DI623_08850 [Sphingomonas sanxanigenens]|uniref:UPF0235 protein DI623_08850 n=1 Tax=Sphingomonas sanxanigenens TaxID=397260 RepID=A0A2W5A5R0_9SPHN|nr:MAG: hypothetical protein DI623_08850 [Sphingomonas sanxanigenens]